MNRVQRIIRGVVYRVPGIQNAVAGMRRRGYRSRAKRAGLDLIWHEQAPFQAAEFRKGDRSLIVAPDHMTYFDDIINDFETYFTAIEPVETDQRHVADFSRPAWHSLAVSGRRVFLPSFTEGEGVCQFYLDHAKLTPGSVVLDLGANCGLASLAFGAAVGPAGLVIALEPDPRNFDALLKNLDLHGTPNIRPLNKGVWCKTGVLEFESDGSMGAIVAPDKDAQTGRGRLIQIAVTTLDDLAERLKLARVDFVKMDIETAERQVVPSLDGFLRRFRPRLIIEAHEAGTDQIIRNFLTDRGYHVCLITQPGQHQFSLLLCEPEAFRTLTT